MLNKLKQLFSDKEPLTESDKQQRLQLAAAVLMFEVSKSDDSVDAVELEQIKTILAEQFALEKKTIQELVEQAQSESDSAISLHEFTRNICAHCDHQERITILQHLWKVAFADGRIDQHERHFIRKIAGLLYLTDQDINLARTQAQA
ncbi:MAG: TerB family tellurite resistance protein [Arenicella sp.]